MTSWTPRLVEARLREAMKADARFRDDPQVDPRPDAPTDALSWLDWLEPDEAKLLVARIEGASWKAICWRFDISRPTADRWWRYALGLIAWRLNGHRTGSRPSLRSMLRRSWPDRGCETSPGATRTARSG